MPNSSRLIDEYGFTPFNGWTISGLYVLHRLIHQSLEIYYDQYRNKKTGKINKTLAARETNLKYETFTAYYRAWEHAQHYTVEEIEKIFQDEPDRKLLIDITHGLVVLIGRQGLILDDAKNPMNAADMLSLLSGGRIVDSQGREIPGARYVIEGDYIKENPTVTIRPYHPQKIGFAVGISLMRRAIARDANEIMQSIPELERYLEGDIAPTVERVQALAEAIAQTEYGVARLKALFGSQGQFVEQVCSAYGLQVEQSGPYSEAVDLILQTMRKKQVNADDVAVYCPGIDELLDGNRAEYSDILQLGKLNPTQDFIESLMAIYGYREDTVGDRVNGNSNASANAR